MVDSIASMGLSLDPQTVKAGKAANKTHQAAQQFESLLIGQLLKSSREASGSGWLGAGDDDQAGEIGMEVAEQQFASMLAAGGGLGLAKLVETGLDRDAARKAAPPEGTSGT